ncbi:MAG: hypothetical protein INH41_16075 [Myxococcaceae bacterium]|nr:hypothetical protein [Myxococcaceae bacterium]
MTRPSVVAPSLPSDDGDAPLPPVPVRSLPRALRAKAKWVDEQFGNRDGTVGPRELAAYKRAYGSDAGHLDTIAALERHLELGTPAPRPARTVVAPASPALTAAAAARRLVHAGGRGTAADVECVVAELQKLPGRLLDRAYRAGVRVVACRDSVTDHLTNLRGVTPRGWPPGSTWDRVPGLYDPASMTVVMATHDGARGVTDRSLPDFGYGHGSFNALFHEFGHALDGTNALGADSRSPEFRAAYKRDTAALRAANDTYLLQPGDAGPEEAYAEMAARYFGNDPRLRPTFPNLSAFFEARAHELGVPA